MLTANQEKWLKALESDEFSQTKGRLQCDDSYCCLGVACRVAGVKGPLLDATLTGHPDVMSFLRLTTVCGFSKNHTLHSLTYMNDEGKTFKEIAAVVRAYPEAYFDKS